MLLHNAPRYALYFGDADDALVLDEITRSIIKNNPFQLPLFHRLQKIMHITDVTLLHQTHGAQGIVITNIDEKPSSNLSVDGDYLVTNMSHLGLGIFTADCLPVICYDSLHNVIGIAHAGWKGAVAGVVPAMLTAMKKNFNIHMQDLLFFFGPSAKACCYEVQEDILPHFDAYYFADKVIQKNNSKLYLDLPSFVRLQLKSLGVPLSAINLNYNDCTMCNTEFFSHRRQQERAGRQITLVALK